MTNIRWIVLGLILLASFVSYVLRTNFNIVAEMMGEDLGLTEIQLGIIFSSFAAGYAIFQFPGGVAGNRFGARRLMAALMVAWGLLALGTALVPGPEVLSSGAIVACLVVIRFLVGATHAPIYPVTGGGTTANWFPVGGWGLPLGLSSTGLTLGAAATAPVVVMLMEAFGWRGALLITAPAAFVVAAVWYWYVRDFPKQHASVSAEELALIDANRPPPEAALEKGSWKKALKNRDILLLTVSYFCMNYVFYLFFSWFFFYLVDVKEFPVSQAGTLTAAQWILGAIGATAGGFFCDMLIRRYGLRLGPRMVAVTGLVLCSLFLFFGAIGSQPILAVVLLCIAFGCTQITEAAYWVAAVAIGGRHAETASGVLNTGGNVVGFVGGMLVPVTATAFGWTTAVSTGSIFAIVGAILWFFIRSDRPMDAAETRVHR